MVQDLTNLVSSCWHTFHARLILGHLGLIRLVTDNVLISFKEFLFDADCVDHLRSFIMDTRQMISLVRCIIGNKTMLRPDLEIICIEVAF